MPDYSLPEVRDWWAAHVRRFAELGAGGAWLDMNDPAVGAVELDEMHFDRGCLPHESYHNQYALGMARASHAGFLAARPAERPFLLARSAFVSSSHYAAVWTVGPTAARVRSPCARIAGHSPDESCGPALRPRSRSEHPLASSPPIASFYFHET